VDSREAAQVEAGDILIPLREGRIDETHIVGELGDAVDGRSGRRDVSEITMFKSLGLAVEDVATAQMVVRKARELHIGREIPI
jgi:ornithine cyclodeaminase/alanine dehydrogenase-like protein (mu-crystallin family)